jgi:hypothetical protein
MAFASDAASSGALYSLIKILAFACSEDVLVIEMVEITAELPDATTYRFALLVEFGLDCPKILYTSAIYAPISKKDVAFFSFGSTGDVILELHVVPSQTQVISPTVNSCPVAVGVGKSIGIF